MRAGWVCACALVGAAVDAGAAIVYRDIPDIHLVGSGNSGNLTANLDLDANGTTDVVFSYQWSIDTDGRTTWHQSASGNFVDRSSFPSFGAESLAAGFLIQPALEAPPSGKRQWGTDGTLAQRDPNGGPFQNHGWWGGPGYPGVRFSQADGTHYGWISMSAGVNLDVYSLAYQSTPDAPIAAGAVPGPGAGAVLAGVLGAAGLRRRR